MEIIKSNLRQAIKASITNTLVAERPMDKPLGIIPYSDIKSDMKFDSVSRSKSDKLIKPRRVQIIDTKSGKVKYEGVVYPYIHMMDATRITLDNGGSRIHYWRDDTEKLIYLD